MSSQATGERSRKCYPGHLKGLKVVLRLHEGETIQIQWVVNLRGNPPVLQGNRCRSLWRKSTLRKRLALVRGSTFPMDTPHAWFPRCRLAWLERQAKASGHIGRAEIMEVFGICAAHASNDLQAYLALNPGALVYNTSRKYYEWTGKKLAITPAPWANFPQ